MELIKDIVTDIVLDSDIVILTSSLQHRHSDINVVSVRTEVKNKSEQKQKQSSSSDTNVTQNSSPKSQGECFGCGRNFHQGGCRNYPAANIEYHSCKRIGHFESVCQSKNKDNDTSVHALKFNKKNRLWCTNAVTDAVFCSSMAKEPRRGRDKVQKNLRPRRNLTRTQFGPSPTQQNPTHHRPRRLIKEAREDEATMSFIKPNCITRPTSRGGVWL